MFFVPFSIGEAPLETEGGLAQTAKKGGMNEDSLDEQAFSS